LGKNQYQNFMQTWNGAVAPSPLLGYTRGGAIYRVWHLGYLMNKIFLQMMNALWSRRPLSEFVEEARCLK